jgi:hypothetical protein
VQAGHPRCAGRTKAFFVHEGGYHIATLQTWIHLSPAWAGLFAFMKTIYNINDHVLIITIFDRSALIVKGLSQHASR